MDKGQWKIAAEWWRAAGWQVTGSSIPAEYQDEMKSIYYEKQIDCEVLRREVSEAKRKPMELGK